MLNTTVSQALQPEAKKWIEDALGKLRGALLYEPPAGVETERKKNLRFAIAYAIDALQEVQQSWRMFKSRGFIFAAHIASGPYGSDTVFCRQPDGSWGESVFANVAAIESHEGGYASFSEISDDAEIQMHLADMHNQSVRLPT